MNIQKRKQIRKFLLIFSILLFVGCSGFLLYYLVIQPHYSSKVNEKYRNIYYEAASSTGDMELSSSKEAETETRSYTLDTSYKNNAKDSRGILLKFSKLLEYNSDIKGWLNIPGTKIDYPVLQDYNGGDFYLNHDFEGTKDKNGSLYIDGNCNVKSPSKNIVIHGHNMESTHMMFYELPKYKDLNFYKEHPVITFDSIYKNSQWKIISYMRVSGTLSKNGGFNYRQSSFENDDEFLNFIYQIEMRSLYKCPVDVNEKDRLIMLSTCSYEVDNYRTVVVARRIRKGESADVEVDKAFVKNNVLYPNNWYSHYGGIAPITTTFDDAMSFDEIDWYDGKLQIEPSVGKIITVDKDRYQITSPATLKYLGNTNKKSDYLFVPSTVKINQRTFDVTEISKDAFVGMTKLKELKIGNKVESIESKTFTSCCNLEYVIIGDSVKNIGSKAFYRLENLKKIKIRSLQLENIEDKAFKFIDPKAKFKLAKKNFNKYSKLLERAGISAKSKLVKY